MSSHGGDPNTFLMVVVLFLRCLFVVTSRIKRTILLKERLRNTPSQRKTNTVINVGKRDKGGKLASGVLSPYFLPCYLRFKLLYQVSCVVSLKGWWWDRERRDMLIHSERKQRWRPLTSGRVKTFPPESITVICLHINPLRTWTIGSASDMSYKITATKVVSTFKLYGQFNLISYDWWTSHRASGWAVPLSPQTSHNLKISFLIIRSETVSRRALRIHSGAQSLLLLLHTHFVRYWWLQNVKIVFLYFKSLFPWCSCVITQTCYGLEKMIWRVIMKGFLLICWCLQIRTLTD